MTRFRKWMYEFIPTNDSRNWFNATIDFHQWLQQVNSANQLLHSAPNSKLICYDL